MSQLRHPYYNLPPSIGVVGVGQLPIPEPLNKLQQFIVDNPWGAIAITLTGIGLWMQYKGTKAVTKAIMGK